MDEVGLLAWGLKKKNVGLSQELKKNTIKTKTHFQEKASERGNTEAPLCHIIKFQVKDTSFQGLVRKIHVTQQNGKNEPLNAQNIGLEWDFVVWMVQISINAI